MDRKSQHKLNAYDFSHKVQSPEHSPERCHFDDISLNFLMTKRIVQ